MFLDVIGREGNVHSGSHSTGLKSLPGTFRKQVVIFIDNCLRL